MCSKPFISINFDPLWAWQNLWGHGRIILTKFGLWGMPGDLSYDHFCVLCWPSSASHSIFWCMWRYMKVYKAIWRYMNVYEGIWRYMKVYEGVWRYIEVCGPTCSTLFSNVFWDHFFDFLFFSFFEGLQAPGGISSFFSWNFTSNGVLNVRKGWTLVHAMTWRCLGV